MKKLKNIRLSLKITSQDPPKLTGCESRTKRRQKYEDHQFQLAQLLARSIKGKEKKYEEEMKLKWCSDEKRKALQKSLIETGVGDFL